MSSSPYGSGGPETEKFPDAPPEIAITTAPEDVIDAGLRSLDHCKYCEEAQIIWKLLVVG